MSLFVTILDSTNDYVDCTGKYELRVSQQIGHCMPDLASVCLEPEDLLNLGKAVEEPSFNWYSLNFDFHISGEEKVTLTFKNEGDEDIVFELNEQESSDFRDEIRGSTEVFVWS